ncbi:MAG: hypothetical protein KF855_11885 [Acidobacteria bacterium]|nr:hypothetical protein [Acidobacteriota bacterium]
MDNHNRNCLKKKSFVMILLLVVFVGGHAQYSVVLAQDGLLAKRFLRIIPGVSTRVDVEGLFPVVKSKDFANKYKIDFNDGELAIGVEYSTGNCGDKIMYDWKLPEWTVVGVSYEWPEGDEVPLTDVIIDLKKFEKKQISDVIVHDNYENEEWGILAVYDRKWKQFAGIYLEPAAKFKEKYGCP